MDKRGDGNTFWIIIVMVLALVVLVVLIVFFTQGTSKGNKGLFDCESKGGACNVYDMVNQKCPEGYTKSITFNCPSGTNQVCCIKT